MLVHALAPPTPGGTPVVLHRLLTGLPGVRVEVATNRRLRKRVEAGDGRALAAPHHYVDKWPGWGARWRAGRVVVAAIDFALALVAGVRIARWSRRTGARWIMSVTDEGFSVIAGAVAARVARLPHVIMVFDLWEENAYSDVQRAVAHRLEPRIFRSAAKVVGYCQEIVDLYRAKHGIEGAFIRTPIEVGPPPPAARPRPPGEPAELLMAGAVYWVQEDAVRRLLRVAGRVEDLRTTIIADGAQLAAVGISADRVEAPRGAADFRERVAQADILFMGLSFTSAHPQIPRTGTPARLTDFLAAERPLLVHAPPDSHLARNCREADLAEVVDTPDEAALEAAVRRLLDDPEPALARARRARAHLERVHDAPRVRESFAAILRGL
jgi:hypothetical protein